MTETRPDSYPVPTVQKKVTDPPGVLPRNAQAWLIAGISVIMVAVIALSGKGPKPKTTTAYTSMPMPLDPNLQRIQELRARIEDQARKLAAEQAQFTQTRQALGLPSVGPAPAGSAATIPDRMTHGGYSSQASERSWIATEREKREYQSRFASNIALSYRKEAPTVTPRVSEAPSHPRISVENSALMTRQTENLMNALSTEGDVQEPKAKPIDAELTRADGKLYRLFEGTVLETVLTNRLDGHFSGPINCMVTTNVYSHDRQRLLIPQGSRVLGEVRRVEGFGQQRLAVFFHRLTMPDGYSASLDKFQGLNQIGETGLRDKVNHHYLQVFGASLAIGAIAGLSQSNTRSGFDASAEDDYRRGVATSLSQSSLRILDRYLNVLPTFTIREGSRVKVYLSNDLLLPAYEKHQLPSDL